MTRTKDTTENNLQFSSKNEVEAKGNTTQGTDANKAKSRRDVLHPVTGLPITRADVELLAPAGDWECMKAAVANGADAIFFGVEKFNARARANNFRSEDLPEIMSYLRMYGVKGYLTFNILVFENELEDAKKLIEQCIAAGVDAALVQDLGLVKIIRELSPDFPIHGSTQMTITSAEAAEFTKPYGLERVVLGRENNLKQIRKIGEQAKMPMEVFVHGALCVSYSGQCLTSEMWGGRSANRGECAQACRLPYDLVVDGEVLPMGDVTYLLSPKDLAAINIIPELIEAGVDSFKIEGRLKTPEYVANVVSKYREAIDKYFEGDDSGLSEEEMRELQQSFSRGFTHGFLEGTNNKKLVDGTFPKSRGVYLGRVDQIVRDAVVIKLEAPLKRGDGVVFDAGDPTKKEEGGRVYDLRRQGVKIEGEIAEGVRIELVMGRNDVDLRKLHVGDRVWKTNDPALDRRLRSTFDTDKPYRVFPLHVRVSGEAGQPLRTQWSEAGGAAHEPALVVEVLSEIPLEQAMKRPMDAALLTDQLGRLGGTIYQLDSLECELVGDVMVPVRELNRIRREAVDLLIEERKRARAYEVYETAEQSTAAWTAVKEQVARGGKLAGASDAEIVNADNGTAQNGDGQNELATRQSAAGQTELIALCRSLDQVRAAVQTEVSYIYADFEFIKQFPAALAVAREAGVPIALATPRIHMPGENGYHANILKLAPDAVLVRNTGALQYYLEAKAKLDPGATFPRLIGDFSLNVANHKTVELFMETGIDRVTPSYDLNIQQMMDMLEETDTSALEMVIHQHMPMFHTEHCVYCTFLSEGTDYTNCGRPCEEQRASLQDRIGMSHPVRVDEGCRNTVYNAIEQSGAEYISHFVDLGVKHYRVEFLEEDGDKVREVIGLYREALDGKISGTQVWRTLKATNQLGVTRGQLTK